MIKFIDRGYQDAIVFIPGWAGDCRIFAGLDLKYNYLLPMDFSPFTFEGKFLKALAVNNLKKVSLLGWSLGGFTAVELTCKYREVIDEVILVGIRKKYLREEIEPIKDYLKKNKDAYLYKFYRQCFFRKEDRLWFRKNLLKDYCEKFDLDYLLKTLDYLAEREINPQLLAGAGKLRIIHGQYDLIAPVHEALEVARNLVNAVFIEIPCAGHFPLRNTEGRQGLKRND